eukprot:3333607-Pyramimonas_sp.AAC.1
MDQRARARRTRSASSAAPPSSNFRPPTASSRPPTTANSRPESAGYPEPRPLRARRAAAAAPPGYPGRRPTTILRGRRAAAGRGAGRPQTGGGGRDLDLAGKGRTWTVGWTPGTWQTTRPAVRQQVLGEDARTEAGAEGR